MTPPTSGLPNIPLSRLTLISSRQLLKMLARLDVVREEGTSRSGTHAAYIREMPDGRVLRTIVVLGKKQVARRTLRDILYDLEITLEDFRKALR